MTPLSDMPRGGAIQNLVLTQIGNQVLEFLGGRIAVCHSMHTIAKSVAFDCEKHDHVPPHFLKRRWDRARCLRQFAIVPDFLCDLSR